ncbi:natural killer cells antigen CD94-like isoform X3 [Sander lucioperca]|uniref:natural killer cells antigen CD94-like isoform X3 n=1 Tax=Sander lucioperca TaxID=283035 RepID=UPI00125E0DC1|nr:natural killer cells antigen CD94-like isoform X3 [Sander lucioperca]
MKILLVLSVLLCAALSIRAATVVVAEAAAVPQENQPAPESVVVAEAAAVPQENQPAPESVVPAEAAAVPQENQPAPESVVVAEAAAVPQENQPAPESVVPAEAAAVPQENQPAPESEMDAATDVADGREPVQRQARFYFCLEGWHSFRGNCYYLANHVSSWSSAENYCAGFGGSLASVHNVLEYNFLQRLVKTGGHTFAWIGGYYFQGLWRWEDGSVFDYTNQGSMSSTSSYQCLQVNSQTSIGWSNNGCTTSYPFVCQIRPNC